MNAMFSELKQIEILDLSQFDTSKVKDMENMFSECYKLKGIKGLEKFNTSNIINMAGMFEKLYEKESLDLSSFDTSIVTNMSLMFNECHKLKEIKGIEKFITINVEILNSMFQGCNEIKSLNLSNFETIKVYDISFMFFNCDKLEYLNLSKFKLLNECKSENIFSFPQNGSIIVNDPILIKKLNKNN